MKLDLTFYNRPTLIVAKDLLGKVIHFNDKQIVINETEAYIGQEDPACHASRGRTPRTDIMFGRAGFSYVYFIYGMYHCLNFVTEEEGFPAAVLIRGGYCLPKHEYIKGPGKLCIYMNITREHNAIDIVNSDNFFVTNNNIKDLATIQTPRIGISKGQDKLWRFYAKF